ncbi:heparanase-like protein 1 isoform X2 [Mangifera indica]|uniref:heparanase-like protein 1 isoform X2 n=2 Tax=Mangifera indica TaxID=29780 RepID=UPI001CFA0972|nr:heparanase-like protein 1 isoform X2 [Mangifera indica]
MSLFAYLSCWRDYSDRFTMRIFLSFFFLFSLPAILAQEVTHPTILVDGTTTIATNDENFICATLDWWPHDKCDYNQCPWHYTSAINLDLSHPLLTKAIQAFKSLRIRIGGSLQDQVLYDVGDLKAPCHPFRKMTDGLFGFSKGCLHMDRWDELNHLFSSTGAIVTFGLNALYGRHQIKKGVWGGAWDPSNARDFMKYTLSKGYHIDSWEFGNELSGSGIGASVGAELYGKDLINLKNIIRILYRDSPFKPLLVAPGGFFDEMWYSKLLQVSGSGVVNTVTHHIYNLGAGVDPNLVSKILDPDHLSLISETFSNLKQTIEKNAPWASAWVGESGGAYNSGGRLVSNTFVNSFWYLDQLGMASKYNTKVYCRQTLIGGNYGLLNATTFVPNPDYYSALLWHRLMGKGVLAVATDAPPYLRVYAHCSKGRKGITVLLINLSNLTDYMVTVQNSMNMKLVVGAKNINRESSLMRSLKKTVSWVGSKSSEEPLFREEYHLAPKNGYLQSQTMLLNGIPLELTKYGGIPRLNPVHVRVNSPIYIAPLSIAFIVFPNFDAPACV